MRTNGYVPYLILVLLCFFSMGMKGAGIQMNIDLSGKVITRQFEILEDEGGDISFDELLSGMHEDKFQGIENNNVIEGHSTSTYFLRTELFPGNLKGGILYLNQDVLRSVEMLILEGSLPHPIQVSGTGILPSSQALAKGNIAFAIPPSDVPLILFIRFSSKRPISFGIQIFSQSDWASFQSWNDFIFGVYWVILSLALLSGLIMIRFRREFIYILYMCYVMTFGMALTFIYGFGSRILDVRNGDDLVPILVMLSVIFLLEMYRKVMGQLKSKAGVMRALRVASFAIMFLLVGATVFGLHWMEMVFLWGAPFLFLSMIVLTVIARIKKLDGALFFLIGWLFMGVSALMYLSGFIGVLEVHPLFKYAPFFGSMGELIFFLLALNHHSGSQNRKYELALTEIRLQVVELQRLNELMEREKKSADKVVDTQAETKSAQMGFPNGLLLNALTEREEEVLLAISKGMTNREIADSLFISINTVKTHVLRIYSKLEVNNRTEAALKAMGMNLVPAEA